MWSIYLSLKYLFSGRKEKMISLTGTISIVGLALGVAALIVVLSIMNGFDREIRERIMGTHSHMVVTRPGGLSDQQGLSEELLSVPGVIGVAPFITGQAVLRDRGSVTGILLKGIEPEKEAKVTSVVDYSGYAVEELAGQGIILGGELMKAGRIYPGDEVELVLPYSVLDVERIKLNVVGSFVSGRYDYDANIAIVGIDTARKIFRMGDNITGLGMRINDPMNANTVRDELRLRLGRKYDIRSWMDMDRNLVAALAMEKKIMFVVLTIIIIVACFNIASSLIMLVMEKTKDIGVLKAIGANGRGIRTVFIFLGGMIGFFGAVFGVLVGVKIASNINSIAGYIEKITGVTLFPGDVYYFSEIPVNINSGDILTVVMVAFGLVLAASLYPAWKASRLDPVEAIRYE